MVRQMGGDITVKSKFGKGTTFYISLKVETKVLNEDLKKLWKNNFTTFCQSERKYFS